MEAQFISIDQIRPIVVSLDQEYKSLDSVISTQSSICGGVQPEYLHTSSITYQHNRRTFWIYLYSDYGGLISFKLSISKCEYEGAGCIENYPSFCLQWKLHQYSLNSKYITTNSDGWSFYSNFDSSNYQCSFCDLLIFSQIEYQTQLPPHIFVLIRFFKYDTNIIIVDYLYGKQIISNHYLIEILIKDHHDPILKLNFKSSSLSSMRDFEVFYTEPEIMFKNLNEGCLEQIDTRCMICQEGWIYDQLLENCHPICGDKGQLCQTRNFEVSEIIINKFNEGCLEQIETRCLICKEGWIQDQFFENCRPICGDGVIQGQEKCDDANLISNDSCINVNIHVQTFAKLVNLEFVLNVFLDMILILILIVFLCVEMAMQFPIRLNNAI
ncbi:unnamed protein product [Paramecium octaurelia]|uniref:Transmembrane protein n=1 Tax=Paramecium octaurelia TaxID=43137 RepID=A0A8S1XV84_PAROT|nr:unnamed protein product [Paramecium octaurelia]